MKHFELTREYIDILVEAIEQENKERTKELIGELHPADIAEIFDELSKEQNNFIFPILEPEIGADVLIELEDLLD